ncbi:protein-tyrosine-phosphatase [uncultured Polaribacter sp.]|uniref:arsenate-mycothiol transferase ArsC n=1 Tax=uncultured Polaribacter sp. TaxID=174711 RepID=UPI0026260DC4|nr:protein-tyrosine-phosphatase [uncultured Polaribacter sp.]
MHQKIKETIANLEVGKITADRKGILQPLIQFIQEKRNIGAPIQLNFICTHNSRRSHLTQIWAQTMAAYFKVRDVQCYSGGTATTAMFPKVVETLKGSGFEIYKISEAKNPIYAIHFDDNSHPIIGFSKKYDDEFNPKSAFAAVMTCSQADDGCPFILGAEKRIPITYEDPKLFDGKENQSEKYKERSLQIASEMFYVFSQIV